MVGYGWRVHGLRQPGGSRCNAIPFFAVTNFLDGMALKRGTNPKREHFRDLYNIYGISAKASFEHTETFRYNRREQ
jgi:hypothetical protein